MAACFFDDAGELVAPSGQCDAGGVGAGQGDVFAALVDISSNNGSGVATGGDVNIREGNLCGNTTDLIRLGESNLDDVTVCKETTGSDFLREAASDNATSENITEPVPKADPTIRPTEDSPQTGDGGEPQSADDSSGGGGGGGCNAFAEGLIYFDGSWLVLGILSLGMVFARLRKDRCPYLVLGGTFSGPTDRVNQDHPALS